MTVKFIEYQEHLEGSLDFLLEPWKQFSFSVFLPFLSPVAWQLSTKKHFSTNLLTILTSNHSEVRHTNNVTYTTVSVIIIIVAYVVVVVSKILMVIKNMKENVSYKYKLSLHSLIKYKNNDILQLIGIFNKIWSKICYFESFFIRISLLFIQFNYCSFQC